MCHLINVQQKKFYIGELNKGVRAGFVTFYKLFIIFNCYVAKLIKKDTNACMIIMKKFYSAITHSFTYPFARLEGGDLGDFFNL